uniref:Putative licpodalin-4 1 n=1 Tax=Amblyomma triste TaxID=251400 RepID=A0A023G8Z7_AMBTT
MRLIALLWLFGAFTFPSSCGSENKSDEPMDAIKAIGSVPHVVLLAATRYAPLLECVTADVTALNASASTATYTWYLKGQTKGILADYFISEEAPDRGVFYIRLDSDTFGPVPTQALYSDYKNCLIEKTKFMSEDICLLWVSQEPQTVVPEECFTEFDEKCGDIVLLYTDDACK